MRRAAFLLFALAGLMLWGRPAVGDDDSLAAAQEQLRAQLIDEAQRALKTDAGAALISMRRSLASDMQFAVAYTPADEADTARLEALRATLAERMLLLGDPTKDADADYATLSARGDGAIWGAIRLEGWLRGTLPSDVILTDAEPDGANPATYRFPPEPKEEPGPAKGDDTKPQGDADPKPSAKDDDEPPAQGETDPTAKDAPKPADGEKGKGKDAPAKDAPAKDEPAKDEAKAPEAPPKPKTPEEIATGWAKDVRVAEGDRFVGRDIDPQPATDLDALLKAAEQAPSFRHEGLDVEGGLKRFAIAPTGLFDYNLPSALLRSLQARERSLRMQADRPQPTLVDGSMVREKQAAVKRLEVSAERAKAWRAGLIADLDNMVLALDAWKTQAALIATDIDGIRKELGTDPTGDEPPPEDAAQIEAAHLPMRLAQARESLATLEIGLLLNTATRAGFRLELLERIQRSASQELREADEVRARYDEALLRLRTARRIDRLERDLKRLQVWANAGSTEALTGRGAKRQAAYQALIKLHEAVRDAVSQRRVMTVGSSREAPAADAAEAAKDRVKRAAEEGGTAAAGPRLSLPVAAPETATWDPKFIDLARTELLDPELEEMFDAHLVAAHYSEASDEIHRIVRAERSAMQEGSLRENFAAARTAAERALAPLAFDIQAAQVQRLPAMFDAAVDDFEAAMEGIAEQRDRNKDRLGALIAYQALLERQGTRSLLIRVDRSQRDPFFGDVVRETRSALESAGEWASFRGDTHLGRWLGQRWVEILLAVLAIVGAIVISRLLRRMVDARIDSIVAGIPEIGASVREERERARRRRKRSDEAARAITDDDVIRVQTEDAEASEGTNEDEPTDDEAKDADDEPKEERR